MKNFIHFKKTGKDFRLFLNEKGALPNAMSSGLNYLDYDEDFAVFWANEDYETGLAGQWIRLKDLSALQENQGAMLCRALGYFWEFMPDSKNGLTISTVPERFGLKNQDREKITFFGGSFFPWHEGHRECIDQALEYDRNVIVVPDRNPWKEQGRKSCYWAAYKQICDELNDTPFSVFPGFWGQLDSNPTVSWLPKVELSQKSLLMGDDTFFGLHLWKDVESLLVVLDSVYVVPRQGKSKHREVQKELLKNFNPNLKFYFLDKHPYEKISSTQIRESWEN